MYLGTTYLKFIKLIQMNMSELKKNTDDLQRVYFYIYNYYLYLYFIERYDFVVVIIRWIHALSPIIIRIVLFT